jgi:hypothetical protein
MLLAGFLVSLPFHSECGGDMFLRNFGLFPNHTAFRFRRPYTLVLLKLHLKISRFYSIRDLLRRFQTIKFHQNLNRFVNSCYSKILTVSYRITEH